MEEDGRNDTAVVHGVKAEGVSIVADGDSDNNGGGDGPRAAGGRGSGGISKEQRS